MAELLIYQGLDNGLINIMKSELKNKPNSCIFLNEIFSPPSYSFITAYADILAEEKNISEYNILNILKTNCSESLSFDLRNYFCKRITNDIRCAYQENIVSKSIIKNAAVNILYWFSTLSNNLNSNIRHIIVKSDKYSKYGCLLLSMLSDYGIEVDYITLSTKVDIFKLSNNTTIDYKIVNISNNLTEEKQKELLKSLELTKQEIKPSKKVDDTKNIKVTIESRPYIVPKFTKHTVDSLDSLIEALKLGNICSCIVSGCGDNYGETHNKLYELRKIITVIDDKYDEKAFNALKCRANGETILKINSKIENKLSISELEKLKINEKETINLVKRTAEMVAKAISSKEIASIYRDVIEWYFREKADKLRNLYNICVGVAQKVEDYTPALNGIVAYFGDLSNIGIESMLYLDIASKYKASTVLVNWNIETIENRSDSYGLLYGDWTEVKLGKPCDKTEYPKGELRVKASTLAHEASQEIEQMLYGSGEALGLYMPNQFNTNNSIVLSTTFDELALLWKNEAVVRPNFKVDSDNNVVTIPTIFADVIGTGNMSDAELTYKIRELITDHTTVYLNEHIKFDQYAQGSFIRFMANVDEECTINGVKLIENGKLVVDNIKDIWVYSRLNTNKQELILNKMQEVVDNCQYLNVPDGKLQKIMVAMLTLPQNLVNDIIWFDFTKMSPKIIMVFNGKNPDGSDAIISMVDCIRLYFCNLIGFDVAVFTPTSYRSLDCALDESIYEKYDLGYPRFDIVFGNNIKEKLEDKPNGIFKRFFKWRSL